MLIVFDWDGTLVDSKAHIVRSVQAAARDCGLPALPSNRIQRIIGLGLSEAFDALYANITYPEKQMMIGAYSLHFRKQEGSSALFPGVERVLNDLMNRGHVLAVATGKSRRGLDRQMQNFALTNFFQFSRCADETASKPDPLMLLELLKVSGFPSHEALIVGDTTYDLEMAQRAGIKAIGVSYGVHHKSELVRYKPLQVIDSLEEMLSCT